MINHYLVYINRVTNLHLFSLTVFQNCYQMLILVKRCVWLRLGFLSQAIHTFAVSDLAVGMAVRSMKTGSWWYTNHFDKVCTCLRGLCLKVECYTLKECTTSKCIFWNHCTLLYYYRTYTFKMVSSTLNILVVLRSDLAKTLQWKTLSCLKRQCKTLCQIILVLLQENMKSIHV